VNRIAQWNGHDWRALGGGVDSWVRAIAVHSTNVFVGGQFTNAGGVHVNGIARWDGSAWSALGSGVGGATPWVASLEVSGTSLFVGGWFTNAEA